LSHRVLELRAAKTTPSPSGGDQAREEDRVLLARIKEELSWQYRFAGAVHRRAKDSVTRLTHPNDEFARHDRSDALERLPIVLAGAGGEISGPSAARTLGTATHLVISSLDLRQPVTLAEIEKTRDRLVAEGAIVESVSRRIDAQAILAFFESALGAIARDERNTVWREWPFTFGLPACDAAAAESQQPGEIIVVQGVIDLLVRTPEGLIVIDFKSDHVSGDEIGGRVEVYRGQVDLYARAASAILGDTVREKWLYFLAPRRAVQV